MHNNSNDNFLNSSKLRFYSMGIVAKNKPLNTDEIECTPTEELNMLEGEIHSKVNNIKAKGTGDTSSKYSAEVITTMTITAKWLPIHGSNRMTSPDVRRGESVMIYQYADTDRYYWVTLKQDSRLRKLETVVYAFSSTTDDSRNNTKEDYYYLSVSTHKGLVQFHTTTNNNEPFSYDINIDTKNGEVMIKDDIGNLIQLTSKNHRLLLKNASNSTVDLAKDNISIKSNSSINVSTGFLSIQAKDTLIHSEVKIVGNLLISGDMSSNNVNTGHISSSSAAGHYPR